MGVQSPWRNIVCVDFGLSKPVVRDRSRGAMVLVCIVKRNILGGVIGERLSKMNILKMSGPVWTEGHLGMMLICCGARKRVVIEMV
jgi:hypothetical protein